MSNLRFDVVGNDNYYITEHLEIGKNNNFVNDLEINENKVTIKLYGYKRTVDLEWLYWLSHYKLNLPSEYKKHIFNIEFYNHALHSAYTNELKIVIFSKPVEINNNNKVFRLLARFPRYAIAKDGTLLNLSNMKVTTPYKRMKNIYTVSEIKDQAKIYGSSRRLTHRLVALAWVPNPDNDFIARPIVDHIDGDKTNCHADNLRWISFLGNTLAAVDQGLNATAIPVLSKNIETGEVEKWGSLTRFTDAKGRTRIDTNLAPLYNSKVWKTPNGDYLLKYLSDTTPWASKEDIKSNTNTKIIISTKENTYTLYGHSSLRDFAKKEFDIVVHGKQGMNKSIKQFLDRYIAKYGKDIKIIIDRPKYQNDLKEILYKAKNLSTGEVILNKTRKELLECTNISKTSVAKSIINAGRYSYNDWIFTTIDIDFPKKEDISAIIVNHKVKVTNIKTNESVIYNSLREASRELNIPRRKLKAILNITNNIYSDLKITII